MTPKDTALGYGWRCPYCEVLKDEGQSSGVYWLNKAVCTSCAPIIQAARKAAESR